MACAGSTVLDSVTVISCVVTPSCPPVRGRRHLHAPRPRGRLVLGEASHVARLTDMTLVSLPGVIYTRRAGGGGQGWGQWAGAVGRGGRSRVFVVVPRPNFKARIILNSDLYSGGFCSEVFSKL